MEKRTYSNSSSSTSPNTGLPMVPGERKRIRVFKNGCKKGGKVISLPMQHRSLLDFANSFFQIDAKSIYDADGAEILDIALLRDNETIYVSSGEPFIDSTAVHEFNIVPCQSVDEKESLSFDQWVTLNVGGTCFTTTRATLTKDSTSMLARMFSAEDPWCSAVDKNGAYLVDRSPKYFEPILNYLRVGRLVIDEGVNPKGVLEEVKFYGLTSLVEELETHISAVERKALSFDRREFIRILLLTSSNSELRCQGINLAGADLSKLDLRSVNFKMANLTGANLGSADLGRSCFDCADLSNACLDGAKLNGVKMMRANMEGCSMVGCNFEDPFSGVTANLEGANLKLVNLESSQMTGINLRVANLKGANMKNCVLHDAILAGADLENCDLTGCDLQGANLRGSNVVGTIFLDIVTPLHMVHLM